MSPTAVQQPPKIPVLDNLTIGRIIKPTANGSNGATMTGGGTRESSLHIPTTDAGRKGIALQAVTIGKKLVQYAAETRDAHFDTEYAIRSPCEGHLLKQSMVLLRDALLPFENFEEVVIPIPGKKGRNLGIRYTEQNWSLFLAELMTKSLTQNGVFKAAISLLAPELASIEGYGCQYSQGLILPSFVAGSDARRLLWYLPVKLDDTSTSLVFRNEHQDYYRAPQSEITMAKDILKPGSFDVAMLSSPTEAVPATWIAVDSESTTNEESSRVLKLHLRFSENKEAVVDLGQISRGRRYAYSVDVDKASHDSGFPVPARVHSAADVLVRADFGLVTAKDGGIHLIPASSNIILLALLGTLYPENVIVVGPGGSLEDAERAGKSLPNSPKFVLQLCNVTRTCMPRGY